MPTLTAARGIQITPRLPDFVFGDEALRPWFGGDLGRTAAWNALGVLAGVGEASFIEAARALIPHLDDADTIEEVGAFIQQEAAHATVHARFNRVLAAHGFPVEPVRSLMQDLVAGVESRLGLDGLGAASLAGELVIGEFGHCMIDDPVYLADADPLPRALWLWHSYEEVEHQAALHDAWCRVYGTDRVARDLRMIGLVYLVTAIGVAWPAATWAMVEAAQPGASRARSTWRGLAEILIGPRGLLRRVSRNLAAVSDVGFHPFSVREPTEALAAHREALARPEWTVPARAAKTPEGRVAPVGARLNLRALAVYTGFVAFAVRRGWRFVREVRAASAEG